MIHRSETSTPVELNVVGSSTFGIYPKISKEMTYNMLISDGWLIDYIGYDALINLGDVGRGIFTSNILNQMIAVVDDNVYLLEVVFNPNATTKYTFNPVLVGTLLTITGNVYFAENNANQIALTDGAAVYIYNHEAPSFTTLNSTTLGFLPGYITFHDTYFICAASQDTFYSPPANNTWRLSASNDGTTWPADSQSIGLIETKPDITQAVIKFPSGGNAIFVFGQNVTEPWFDYGNVLFPYQRNTGFNIDYGCINPATIAAIDEMVVWLGINEKAGPAFLVSTGGRSEEISTDGINHLLDNLSDPADSEAFIFRMAGHVIYHINFYTDNLSLFYDFETKKFFHACDENRNYFIISDIAFLDNNYYGVSKNNGNLYALSLTAETYDGAEIPRIRVCKSIRKPSQEYFVVTDCGFTIQQGNTEPQYYNQGPLFLITQDGKYLVSQGGPTYLLTENSHYLTYQNGDYAITQEVDPTNFSYFVTQQDSFSDPIYPRVDLSISYDGGETFGNNVGYDLNPLGKRINMLRWWQLGVANDWTAQFRFWGLGRFVCTNGIVNTRT